MLILRRTTKGLAEDGHGVLSALEPALRVDHARHLRQTPLKAGATVIPGLPDKLFHLVVRRLDDFHPVEIKGLLVLEPVDV